MNKDKKKKNPEIPDAPFVPDRAVPVPSVPNRAHTEMSHAPDDTEKGKRKSAVKQGKPEVSGDA